jgi:predicted RNase H-like HicB family nuclease
MKATDKYHRWVEWSEEDQAYVGRCPDLFLGGCHGDNPIHVAKELQDIIDEWETILTDEDKPLPPAKIKPMAELA